MSRTIAMLTDFGTADTYVGVMKGVIQRISPGTQIIDLTHDIAPQGVRLAALSLMNNCRYFAPGTIFLVVVDPGVGSTRRPIAVEAGDYTFVAPDNGVLSYVLAQLGAYQAVELGNPAYRLKTVSRTFHGRDIFAPAAAHLAAGVALADLGGTLETLVRLPVPEITLSGRRVTGEALHIDRFGNVITSIGKLNWISDHRLTLNPVFNPMLGVMPISPENVVVMTNDHEIAVLHRAYSDVPRGELMALVGSDGYLELSVNQGNAAQRVDIAVGDRIVVELGEPDAAIRD
ncbi:MAG: SAM hydrolase/SAM-dependent halogenase family protein [Chloroflexota bacterium]